MHGCVQAPLAGCRRVALAHHPDKLHHDLANAANNGGTFTLAKTAVDLILDPAKRSLLDVQLVISRLRKQK